MSGAAPLIGQSVEIFLDGAWRVAQVIRLGHMDASDAPCFWSRHPKFPEIQICYIVSSEGSTWRALSGSVQHPPKTTATDPLTFAQLRDANVERCETAFHALDQWNPLEWAGATAGELGEAANLTKKYRLEIAYEILSEADKAQKRSELREQIADELADVVAYLDLWAARLEIDLGAAVRKKFNEVSQRVGSDIVLDPDIETSKNCGEAIYRRDLRELEEQIVELTKQRDTASAAAATSYANGLHAGTAKIALRDALASDVLRALRAVDGIQDGRALLDTGNFWPEIDARRKAVNEAVRRWKAAGFPGTEETP